MLDKAEKYGWKRVYILKDDRGYVKIGCSKNIDSRLRNISTQGALEEVERYYTDYCSNAFELEEIMHEKFSDFRIKGEWFNADFEICKKELIDIFSSNALFEERETDDTLLISLTNSFVDGRRKERNRYLIENFDIKSAPCIPDFLSRNNDAMQEVMKIKGWSAEHLYETMFDYCSERYDMDEALRIFVDEKDRLPSYKLEMAFYFTELSDFLEREIQFIIQCNKAKTEKED